MRYNLIIILFVLPILGFSHGGEDHSKDKKKKEERNDSHSGTKVDFNKKHLIAIDNNYKIVKPIFVNKCFDCHSSSKPLPWYSKVPLVGSIVKGDRKEGLTHLDLTKDFPFGGHGGPIDDIKAIQKSIDEESMPPLRYKAFHWRSGLTEKEKEQVNQWVEKSLQLLKEPKGGT